MGLEGAALLDEGNRPLDTGKVLYIGDTLLVLVDIFDEDQLMCLGRRSDFVLVTTKGFFNESLQLVRQVDADDYLRTSLPSFQCPTSLALTTLTAFHPFPHFPPFPTFPPFPHFLPFPTYKA